MAVRVWLGKVSCEVAVKVGHGWSRLSGARLGGHGVIGWVR